MKIQTFERYVFMTEFDDKNIWANKGGNKKEDWRKFHTENSAICTTQQIKEGATSDGLGVWHVWGRRETHTSFWWEHLKERNYSRELDARGSILEKILRRYDEREWIGLIWFRSGNGARLL
jgi:hypothetical protein